MTLTSLAAEYLAYKRALGYRFRNEATMLRAFCRQLGEASVPTITPDRVRILVHAGATSSATVAHKYRVWAGLVRHARVRHGVALAALPPAPPRRPSAFVPYIYSHADLTRLLAAVPAVCSPRACLDADVLRTVLLVLYGAGLRLSEALALTWADVDLAQAVLTIRQTKFSKTRLVPLGQDLAQAFGAYARRRQRRDRPRPTDPVFCMRDGRRGRGGTLEGRFRRRRATAGVGRKDAPAHHQPRLHDLRHTAAVHRLLQWYRRGANLQQLLPHLATYLGHVNLAATQRYLTLTPTVLHAASRRFARYAREVPHG